VDRLSENKFQIANHVLSQVFRGLALTLLTALFGSYIGHWIPNLYMLPLFIIELVMIFSMRSFVKNKTASWGLVMLFALISGMTLSVSVMYYVGILGLKEVLIALLLSIATFGISAIVASRPQADFSWLSAFLMAGIVVLIGMMLIYLFVPFGTVMLYVYSGLGIAVFVGFMLFDVWRITHQPVTEEMVPFIVLSLYLDFINLFLFFLQFLGINVNKR
jgi:FtsH-binding integral membrane protein